MKSKNKDGVMKQYRPAHDIVASEPASKSTPCDALTQTGAEALARKLDQWWHERGFKQVRHWTATTRASGERHAIWVVRSNLIKGMPP